MRRFTVLIAVLLLTGCSSAQEALPLKMKATQIEVMSVSVNQEVTPLLTITDSSVISEIISELNQLNRTNFSDPEPPANIYKIIFQDNKNKKWAYYYSDRVTHGGKIYTEMSAEKGSVWKATERLAKLLLGDHRLPMKE